METQDTTRTTAHRRRLEGEVIGVAAHKTIKIVVKSIKTHSKYHMQYSTLKKYAVHDEHGKAHLGDFVLFEACRPLSRTKRWTLVSILKSATI